MTIRPAHASTAAAALRAAATIAAAAVLAACGGSTPGAGGSSPGSPSTGTLPSAAPSPQITAGAPPAGAVDVVREFWKTVGAGRLSEAQLSLTSPDSTIRDWTDTGVRRARFANVVAGSVAPSPGADATIEFAVNVWIEPAGAVSPWGPTGTHTLFERVVRMSDGSWRLVESGTGP